MESLTPEQIENLPNWNPDVTPKEDIPEEEFRTLIKESFELKEKIELHNIALSKLQDALKERHKRIQAQLESWGEKSYKSKWGTLTRTTRYTVKMPRDPDSKKHFYTYLERKGIFMDIITVNHQTLNAFFKAEKEALSGGDDFEIPGLGAAEKFEYISMRKGT